MPLATCVDTTNKLRSFDEFCQAISEYINVPGQTLNNPLFTDEEFEAVAQLNDAFAWPDESNWINWREGLRQIFFYSQLNEHQLNVLNERELGWLQGAPFFLHIANDDPNQVAYLPERDDLREQDRMQRGRPGRFFTRHLDLDDENLVRELTAGFQTTNYKYVLSRSRDMMRRVYLYGPNSCMSHRFNNLRYHPAEVYGSGDFAILASYPADGTLDNSDLRFSGRALISIAHKQFVRAYGNEESMIEMIKMLGLAPGSRFNRNHFNEIDANAMDCHWDRFLKLTDHGVIFPYLDFSATAVQDPYSPSRGDNARLRGIPTNILCRRVNPDSTNGRTRWMDTHRSDFDPAEHPQSLCDEIADHDARVEHQWRELEQRFTQATATSDERTIRPIIWNGAPVVERFECFICGQEHRVAPDESNVIDVLDVDRDGNDTRIQAARGHFMAGHDLWIADARSKVFQFFDIDDERGSEGSDWFYPVYDVNPDNKQFATYDYIWANKDEFFFDKVTGNIPTPNENWFVSDNYLLRAPYNDAQLHCMDLRFTSVRDLYLTLQCFERRLNRPDASIAIPAYVSRALDDWFLRLPNAHRGTWDAIKDYISSEGEGVLVNAWHDINANFFLHFLTNDVSLNAIYSNNNDLQEAA